MLEMMKKFVRDEEGVTAIEYGLIAALVAVVIIAGLKVLGPALSTLFTNIGNCVKTPSTCSL